MFKKIFFIGSAYCFTEKYDHILSRCAQLLILLAQGRLVMRHQASRDLKENSTPTPHGTTPIAIYSAAQRYLWLLLRKKGYTVSVPTHKGGKNNANFKCHVIHVLICHRGMTHEPVHFVFTHFQSIMQCYKQRTA